MGQQIKKSKSQPNKGSKIPKKRGESPHGGRKILTGSLPRSAQRKKKPKLDWSREGDLLPLLSWAGQKQKRRKPIIERKKDPVLRELYLGEVTKRGGGKGYLAVGKKCGIGRL